jgi:uncharacterized integral membrane protein
VTVRLHWPLKLLLNQESKSTTDLRRTRKFTDPQMKEMKRAIKATWMPALRGYVLFVLLITLSVLVLRNSRPVVMDFLVTDGLLDLMWVMLGCVLLGVMIGYLLATLPLNDQTRREEEPDAASVERAAGAR